MTATMLDLDLDLSLMVGEMEAPHCESPHHLSGDSHDDGPATHYMRIGHSCFGPVDRVIPVCSEYSEHWVENLTIVKPPFFCNWCGANLQEAELNQVLGPIN